METVGRPSTEICAFWFDHFSRRQPFHPEGSSIWMKFGRHMVEVIDLLHANFQLPTLSLIRDFKIGSRVGRASRENFAF